MHTTSTISQAPARLGQVARLLLYAALALTVSACSSCKEEPGQNTNNTTPTQTACQASSECVGEDAGKLCVDGACVACELDDQCAADPSYKDASPICKADTCGPCEPGLPGCACEEGATCSVGECIADVCVECDRGDLDCLCRGNGTCKAGNQCGEENICVACVSGAQGCPCDGETCADGLVCAADVCVPDTCTDGATSCPCDNGSCTSGADYCDDMSVCQECSSDVPGCACDPGDVCLGDNYCDDSTACQACPEADKPETCGCQDDAECGDGLVCDEEDDVCRPAKTCDDLECNNFVCDDSLGDAECLTDQCDEGYTLDPESNTCVIPMLSACTDAVGMPSAEALACEGMSKACVDTINGAVCVDTCFTLNCANQNQDCVPGASDEQDATCGACAPGFTLQADPNDPNVMTCLPNMAANCSPGGDLDSILDECNARFMLCVPDPSGMGATCDGCKAGRVFDPAQNKCVEVEVCGNSVCADNQFCFYPQDGRAPECQARCAEGEAYDEATDSCTTCNIQCDADSIFPSTILDGQGNATCGCSEDVFCSYYTDGTVPRCFETDCAPGESRTEAGTCSTCAISCGDDPGERARVWPRRDSTGECFCETQQGSYRPYGNSAKPESCDSDKDGWINRTAKSVYDDALNNGDAAAQANFRCGLRTIDRVRLVNEYGQRRDVSLCNGKFFDYEPGTYPAECMNINDRAEVVLFEADDLDDDARMSTNNTEYPLYGARKLRASEVNSMTKACVSISADYNANGTRDLYEAQPFKKSDLTDPNISDEEFFFRGMSHYVELHSAYYRPSSVPGEAGMYVISERSRCDDSFPLTYEDGKDYYWDECTRSRRFSFDNARPPAAGYDFADYHCPDSDPNVPGEQGTCDLPLHDAMGRNILSTNADGMDRDTLTDHSLCELEAAGLLPLPDSNWLGMTHHSQFQCGLIKDTLPPDPEPYQIDINNTLGSPSMASSPPQFTINGCDAVKLCNDPNDTSCQDSDPVVPGSNPALALIGQPRAPDLECGIRRNDGMDLANDDVGFALVRYIRPDNGNSLAWQDGEGYKRGCMDESRGTDAIGFSNLCPGFVDNPEAVETAGNSGDYGKIICTCRAEYGGANCEIGCPSVPNSSSLHVGGFNSRIDSNTPLIDFPCEDKTNPCSLEPETSKQARMEWACNIDDFYCLLYPPTDLPMGGTFEGGRRGYWMCGDFQLTRPADAATDPVIEGTTAAGDSYRLDGRVESTPVRRGPLESDGCATMGDCYRAF